MTSFKKGQTIIDCGDSSRIEITPDEINLISPNVLKNGEPAIGPVGPKGDKGDSIVGPMGPKGDTGDTGATGPQGDGMWTLVTPRVIISGSSPVSSRVFSGLNGNVDGEYLLKYSIRISGSSGGFVDLQFNGSTTMNTYGFIKSQDANAPVWFNDGNATICNLPGTYTIGKAYGELQLESNLGMNAHKGFIKSTITPGGTGFTRIGFIHDTDGGATNITSLNVAAHNCTYYGWLELWKRS